MDGARQALASVITCGPVPVRIDRKKIARHVRLERIKRCMQEVESQEVREVFWGARSGFGILERRQHWAMLEGPDSDESDADEDEDEEEDKEDEDEDEENEDEDEENEDEDEDESEDEDNASEEASSEEDDE